MTTTRRALLVVVLTLLSVGCGRPPPPGWTVSGGTPAQRAQALSLLEAAREVAPGALDGDGGIVVAPWADIWLWCAGEVGGCAYRTAEGRAVAVCLDVPDLAAPLAHELAHLILGACSEDAANALGLRIVEVYRRRAP